MRLLLDTHVVIWWDAGEALRPEAFDAIRQATEVYVSAASAWEMAIKSALGKLRSTRALATVIEENGFRELPVTVRHTQQLAALPPLHRDPFDRLLVAQARADGLTLLTRDAQLSAYGGRVLLA
jgi:PIN domain nuclease of toxin-antitoxin system